ncbi:MAG: hypothetical protein AABW49_00185 [Nanoarchaeota archaeon]
MKAKKKSSKEKMLHFPYEWMNKKIVTVSFVVVLLLSFMLYTRNAVTGSAVLSGSKMPLYLGIGGILFIVIAVVIVVVIYRKRKKKEAEFSVINNQQESTEPQTGEVFYKEKK